MSWKKKTCATCEFQIEGYCRKNPPSKHYPYLCDYPRVYFNKKDCNEACSQYQEKK
jgi:hypothetical protein